MGRITFLMACSLYLLIPCLSFGRLIEYSTFSLPITLRKFSACENSNGSRNQLILIPLISFQVPDPAAFFPLNSTYGTRESQDRATEGFQGEVFLASGPNGQDGGSYEFSGTSNSYIEFPNSAGAALDVHYSITFLCWVYYNGQYSDADGPLFVYDAPPPNQWGLAVYALYGGVLQLFLYHETSKLNIFMFLVSV